MVTQINHQITKCRGKKFDTSDLFMNAYQGKTPPGEFKVTNPENPLLSKQEATSKGILVPYTNLQLNPYPNTQLELYSSENLSFQCMAPST